MGIPRRHVVGLLLSCFLLGSCGPKRGAAGSEARDPRAQLEAPIQGPLVVLLQGAEHEDVSLRQQALYLLVKHTEEPGGGAYAARALYDPSPYVKRQGIRALLERWEEAPAREALRGLVAREDVDAYTRAIAGVGLAHRGDTEVLAVFEEAWRAAPDWWNSAPLALPAAILGSEEALASLQSSLSRGDFPLELAFFDACGRSGLEALVPALIEGQPRLEEELWIPVGVALVRLGSPAGKSLLEAALDTTEEEQRMEVVDFLVDLDGEVARDLLRQLAGQDRPSGFYAGLVEVAQGRAPMDLALDALAHPDREMRTLALRALASRASRDREILGTRQWRALRDAALEALEDPEEIVVVEAVRTLGTVGGTAESKTLDKMLADEALSFRLEVASAILAIEARSGAS